MAATRYILYDAKRRTCPPDMCRSKAGAAAAAPLPTGHVLRGIRRATSGPSARGPPATSLTRLPKGSCSRSLRAPGPATNDCSASICCFACASRRCCAHSGEIHSCWKSPGDIIANGFVGRGLGWCLVAASWKCVPLHAPQMLGTVAMQRGLAERKAAGVVGGGWHASTHVL